MLSVDEEQLLLRREEDGFDKSRKSCKGAVSKSCQGAMGKSCQKEHTVMRENNQGITENTAYTEKQTEDETATTTPSVICGRKSEPSEV